MVTEHSRDAFDERISTRLFGDVKAQAVKIVSAHPDRYEDLSHFVRVAVVRLVRAHERGGLS